MLPKKGCFWGNEDIVIAESYFYPIFFKTSGSSGEFFDEVFPQRRQTLPIIEQQQFSQLAGLSITLYTSVERYSETLRVVLL